MSGRRQPSATMTHVAAMKLALAENLPLDEAARRLAAQHHDTKMARLRRKGWHE